MAFLLPTVTQAHEVIYLNLGSCVSASHDILVGAPDFHWAPEVTPMSSNLFPLLAACAYPDLYDLLPWLAISANTDKHTETRAHAHTHCHTETHRHISTQVDRHKGTDTETQTYMHARNAKHTRNATHAMPDTHARNASHASNATRTHARSRFARTQYHARTHACMHTNTHTHTHTRACTQRHTQRDRETERQRDRGRGEKTYIDRERDSGQGTTCTWCNGSTTRWSAKVPEPASATT